MAKGDRKPVVMEADIVNDLTTGGTSMALSAEMGKALKGELDGLTYSDVDAAPAGFGLGEVAQTLNSAHNLDTLKGTGFFKWGSSSPANAPFAYAAMLHIQRSETDAVQLIWQVGETSNKQVSVVRWVIGNVGETEWVNPPMQLGVEYRTTERYNGKPVYAKAVEHTPNENIGSYATTITNYTIAEITTFAHVVEVAATIQYGDTTVVLPFHNDLTPEPGFIGLADITKSAIKIRLIRAMLSAGNPIRITLKYVK